MQSHRNHHEESARRYIELTSEFRDRSKWPCPAEFTVPISCTNRNTSEIEGQDPIVGAYPLYSWFQVPYSQPGSYSSPPGFVTPLRPRSVNGVYYTALWPLRPQLDGNPSGGPQLLPLVTGPTPNGFPVGTLQNICTPERFSCVTAQKFSGGSREFPLLTSKLTDPNEWLPLMNTIAFSPQYLPVSDYLAGANLLRFNYDPSVPLNQNINDFSGIGFYTGWQVVVLTDLQNVPVPPGIRTDTPNFIEGPTPSGVDQYGSIFEFYGKNGSIQTGGVVALYVYIGGTPSTVGFSVGDVLTNVFGGAILSGSTVAWVYPTIVGTTGSTPASTSIAAGAFVTWPEVTSSSGITLPAAVVESSRIISYDQKIGGVGIETSFSDSYDPSNDYYLVDFNSDPRDDWKDFVNGGPRIFVPGGSSRENAYVGLYVANYTLEQRTTENYTLDGLQRYRKITKYDATHRIAYLSGPLSLTVETFEQLDPASLSSPKHKFGSDTFVLRRENPLQCDTISRIGISSGSVLQMMVKEKGKGYKVSETIGSGQVQFLSGGVGTTNDIVNYSTPDYLLQGPGAAFYGIIREVMWCEEDRSLGGILRIEIRQQGEGFRPGNYFLRQNSTTAQGKSAVLFVPQVYQCLEIPEIVSAINPTRSKVAGQRGDFFFLSSVGQYILSSPALGLVVRNTNVRTRSPTFPRYYYAEPNVGTNTWFSGLDIQTGDFPLTTIECSDTQPFPENGLRRIIATSSKTETFTGVYAATPPNVVPTNFGNELTVVYLEGNFQGFGFVYQNTTDPLTSMGDPQELSNQNLPAVGNNAVISGLTSSGVLRVQSYQVLPFLTNTNHSLNYTGSVVSQTQMVCYEIELLSLILPNLPLDNNIGGLIAFYPYLYVELVNVTSPSAGNAGIIYSNNPHARKALFRVNVDDTSTPVISKFIKLDGDGSVQTVKFKPNDNLHFRVFLYSGDLFETSQQDTPPPLPPDFFVQISAEFGIRRLI